jgi:hypothetical protein
MIDKQIGTIQTAAVRLTIVCFLASTLLLPASRAQAPADVPVFKITPEHDLSLP